MIDYISHLTSSTSDTLSTTTALRAGTSTSSSSRCSRVRTVRLVRPPCSGTLPPPGLTCRHGPGLGFSIRGGREHGTGFFVSGVENGSEAQRQGLKVGDQIIRINGFTVEDAVHKEVLQLISNHTHLTLKVRSVGMIPVKDKSTDPLSWQIIPDIVSLISESPPLEDKHHDVRISIAVAQRAKLGCGICKGPEWKPGIFVQFTKEGGIARDAGLRPGDQILYCNSVDFTEISFNEAVNIMKTSRQLDLLVRKGAGSELFPGESSGYNSSASSVTGDQSPSWSDSKRLSIVKEESLELEDRLSHIDFQRYKSKNWDKMSYDWDENLRHFKPTIINLSEKGTTISNNGTEEECKLQEDDTKKLVIVEVHRNNNEDNQSTDESINKITSSSSATSRSSSISSSLSSAITLELQRRSERNKQAQKQINIDEELQKKKILKSVDSEKKQQHDKLMDEFKRAHKKMFSSSSDNFEETSSQESTNNNNNQVQKHEKSENNKELTVKDRQLQLAQRRSTIATPEEASERLTPLVSNLTHTQFSGQRNSQISNNLPPPPPPMPSIASNTVLTEPKQSKKTKAPPVPQKNFHQPLPPPCPTPDYDTISLSSTLSSNHAFLRQNSNTKNGNDEKNNGINKDGVDMESLESFKLNNPSGIRPKPPSTYFIKPKLSGQNSLESNSSSQGSPKQRRPVSVTIGEYPTGSHKRQPSKFDFLNNGTTENNSEQIDGPKNEPFTSRFASELAQTLNRSNLKKRTENSETMIKPQINGIVTISVNNPHKMLTKSQSTNSNVSGNRVTIKISESELKNGMSPNSILKNGNGNNNCSAQHKPLVHQKSISFGEITTVINDRSMHVS